MASLQQITYIIHFQEQLHYITDIKPYSTNACYYRSAYNMLVPYVPISCSV